MPQDVEKKRDYTGMAIGLILLPVLIVFIYFNKGELGRAVCTDLGAVLIAMHLRWELKRHPWFWGTIAFLLALHIPLLLIVRWPEGWISGAVALPFAAVDCLIVLGSLRLVENLFSRNPRREQRPQDGGPGEAKH